MAENQTATIGKDWVHVVMSYFRQHLESSGEQTKYPVLMFYCNWNLHKDLERGIVQDVLKKISIVITDDTTGHPADRISEILSLSQLRSEIRTVLKQIGVESGLFENYENWKMFTELMFPFLMEKPLKCKTRPPTHHWVESLKLYDNQGQVYWKIEVRPGDSKFYGPLLRTDPESPKSF
ncbi:MAG: hypothetical protein Greene041679_588 [Parcubacteria group bacterium Greene0416_79]|nr:MAG: hypothetical protein Greene041679_588 [Parcubacteria group bacterium Greene0416_79]